MNTKYKIEFSNQVLNQEKQKIKSTNLLADFGHNEELAQFVKNNRGSENLMDSEGYIYSKKKANSTKTFWGCASRGKFGCRGSATTEGFRILSRSEHNHTPPIGK